jgi:hypothetical protein
MVVFDRQQRRRARSQKSFLKAPPTGPRRYLRSKKSDCAAASQSAKGSTASPGIRAFAQALAAAAVAPFPSPDAGRCVVALYSDTAGFAGVCDKPLIMRTIVVVASILLALVGGIAWLRGEQS